MKACGGMCESCECESAMGVGIDATEEGRRRALVSAAVGGRRRRKEGLRQKVETTARRRSPAEGGCEAGLYNTRTRPRPDEDPFDRVQTRPETRLIGVLPAPYGPGLCRVQILTRPIVIPNVYPGLHAVFPTTSIIQSVNKAQEENASAILTHALNMCTRKKVKAKTTILEGDPKEMICDLADQMHIDLIVICSRGLGKIKRVFVGSVSDYVTHYAKCVVLIIKPPRSSGATS
ncbi:hypothetical protein ACS0TY_015720 [Phlomoides rotata]